MSGSPDKPLVCLEVSFGGAPAQTMVTPLCQSLSELCRPMLDDDAATRLRLAAHELLENISKYSSAGACELRFELRRSGNGALVATVRTRNVPLADNRRDAEQRLSAIGAAPNPHDHYDSIIADSAARPAGSGLGLARIHAETEYRLSHHFDGATLVIVASAEIGPKKAASP